MARSNAAVPADEELRRKIAMAEEQSWAEEQRLRMEQKEAEARTRQSEVVGGGCWRVENQSIQILRKDPFVGRNDSTHLLNPELSSRPSLGREGGSRRAGSRQERREKQEAFERSLQDRIGASADDGTMGVSRGW